MSDTKANIKGLNCPKCNWTQLKRYCHDLQGMGDMFACIRCGHPTMTHGAYRVMDTDIVFGEPIYDRHLNIQYIQVLGTNYFVVVELETQVKLKENTTIKSATLVYLVPGRSSEIVVIDSHHELNGGRLGNSLLRFHSVLWHTHGKFNDLTKTLNQSSTIRGIRGVLADGATVVSGC